MSYTDISVFPIIDLDGITGGISTTDFVILSLRASIYLSESRITQKVVHRCRQKFPC